jgi:hypothetical protein
MIDNLITTIWFYGGVLCVGLALGLFLFFYFKHRFLISKTLLVFLCFVASVLTWVGIELGLNGRIDDFGGILAKSIKMFAFSLSKEDYPAKANDPEAIKGALLAMEVFSFASISYAILTTVVRSIIAILRNGFWSFTGIFLRKSRHIIFTDLPYEDLKESLAYLAKVRHESVLIVLKQDSLNTQFGSELKSTLLADHYHVIGGTISAGFIAFCAKRVFGSEVTFYSEFKDDEDNIEFAKAALAYCRKLEQPIIDAFEKREEKDKKTNRLERKSLQIPTFYVSYQDPSFQERYNFLQDSYGHIRFNNEYEWNATKFVFVNPITRLMNFDFKKFMKVEAEAYPTKVEAELSKQRFAIHFLGFGRINQALLSQMIPAYQFPLDAPIIQYLVVNAPQSDADAPLCRGADFAKRFAAAAFAGKEGHLPQWDNLAIHDAAFDLDNEAALEEYADLLFRQIYNPEEAPYTAKEAQNYGNRASQAILIISLGSSIKNLEIATKLRQLLKQKQFFYSLAQDENRLKKDIILYPYVKERDFFLPDFSGFLKGFAEQRKEYREKANSPAPLFIDPQGEKEKHYPDTEYESRRLYVFMPWAETEALPPLKGAAQRELRERCFREARGYDYRHESVPIVCFGRNGFVIDSMEKSIFNLAEKCAALYDLQAEMNCSKFSSLTEDATFWRQTTKEDPIFKPWALAKEVHNTSTNDWVANFSLAVSLPTKLAYFGTAMKRMPLSYGRFERLHRKKTKAYFAGLKSETEKQIAAIQNETLLLDYGEVSEALLQTILSSLNDPTALEKAQSIYRRHLPADKKDTGTAKEKRWALSLYCAEQVKKIWEAYQNRRQIPGESPSPKPEEEKAFVQAISLYYQVSYAEGFPAVTQAVQKMEHNRWYAHLGLRGTIPQKKEAFTLSEKRTKVTLKSKMKDVHWCITTNQGLEELRNICFRNALRDPGLFAAPQKDEAEEAAKLVYGDDQPVAVLYYHYYQTCRYIFFVSFWYDTVALASIGTLCSDLGISPCRNFSSRLEFSLSEIHSE